MIVRDEAAVPILTTTLAGYRDYLIRAQDTLMIGRSDAESNRKVRAAIGHALAFHPWRSLAIDQGLENIEVADLMCLLVAGATAKR